MRRFYCVLCAFLLVTLCCTQGFGQYYYSGGGTIPLDIDSTKIVVSFDITVSPATQGSLLSSIARISGTVTDDHAIDDFVVCQLSSTQGYDEFIDSLQAVDGIYLVEPYYLYQDSAFLAGLRFCVGFDEALSSSQIDSINALFGSVIDHEVDRMPNVFVLHNTDSSGYHILDLANAYYELPETEFAHPEFGVWAHLCGYRLYDYYHSNQFHIKKVIGLFDSASVWDFAGLTSHTVKVAVFDDGVASHEDLPAARVLPGVDYAD